MENILLLDVYNIYYRVNQDSRSITLKFLNLLNNINSEIGIVWDYVVACFDYPQKYYRKEIYPQYKNTRQEVTEESQTVYKLFTLMEKLGFTCIKQFGYEADDMIAHICRTYPEHYKVIISTDEDLYQLLDNNTIIIKGTKKNYKKYTTADFSTEYDIAPKDWANVKAIAGCTSDCIKGIDGVGVKKAINYIKTSEGDKIKENLPLIEFNKALTTLPYINMHSPIKINTLSKFKLNIKALKGMRINIADWTTTWSSASLFPL